VGLTAKEYARVRRVRATALAVLGPAPAGWARLAAAQGYADQPHLVREFSALWGAAPGVVVERLRAIAHGYLVEAAGVANLQDGSRAAR
jgi:hypothetical protein